VEHPGRRPAGGPPWAWRLVVTSVLWFLRRVRGWRVRARRPDVVPPPRQPLVVVINHTSNVDAFLVADVVWRGLGHWVRPLARAELFAIPALGVLVRKGGTIPVERGASAGREAAYGHAVEQLRAGASILIAPEGTASHDGSLLPLRHGAARLALEAGVDVLVVTHFGAQRGFSPVARWPERGALVTMTFDLLSPWPDEDASSLTGRIAATMTDRGAELRAAYPKADPDASWWPPYSVPGSPTETARENLERYRQSTAEAIEQARERMAQVAAEHDAPERVAHARERAAELATLTKQRAASVVRSMSPGDTPDDAPDDRPDDAPDDRPDDALGDRPDDALGDLPDDALGDLPDDLAPQGPSGDDPAAGGPDRG
jgi:1-acyl-sn-glycerol-3-phosphate acyltransferase